MNINNSLTLFSGIDMNSVRDYIISEVYKIESKPSRGMEVAEKLVMQTGEELAREVIEEYTDIALNVFRKLVDEAKEYKDTTNYAENDTFNEGYKLGYDHAIDRIKWILR